MHTTYKHFQNLDDEADVINCQHSDEYSHDFKQKIQFTLMEWYILAIQVSNMHHRNAQISIKIYT